MWQSITLFVFSLNSEYVTHASQTAVYKSVMSDIFCTMMVFLEYTVTVNVLYSVILSCNDTLLQTFTVSHHTHFYIFLVDEFCSFRTRIIKNATEREVRTHMTEYNFGIRQQQQY
jgi:hypothetical protein